MTKDISSSRRGSFDVHIADEEFGIFVKNAYNLASAELLPEDEFIRPLFLFIAEQLAGYRLMPSPAIPVRLHLGIIEDPEPNAFAEWSEDVFYLAIYSGQLLSAIEAAVQMQDAIGAFAQDFGIKPDSTGSSSMTTPLGVTNFLNHLRGVKNIEDLFGEPKSPDDPASQRAMLFTSTCIQFALMHEFGHVVMGHLGWLIAKECRTQLREISILETDASPDLQAVLQFFEHEADVFALEVLLRSAYQSSANENNLIIVMLAFLSTIFSWTVLEGTPGLTSGGSHPQASDRMLALPMALIGILEKMPASEHRMQCAIQKCSAIVKRVARKYPPFGSMQAIFSIDAVERADEIAGWMRKMDRATADRSHRIVP
ncbi:hypothetical protein SAMN05421823_12111 [Catalinimonas alkaloidigena]|uniref:Uncharacterized protein n=1 Tax=Catalinimonas alkaloidigena TaxID=1075417 RepID=A0A1G9VIT6_9BACT|nr:hypothetical protein [Catalinimonas alkaloidigena]SDM72198.1 hypothetical protein SAMN05421823_12111 [Catalinimonas alkaloidigena]